MTDKKYLEKHAKPCPLCGGKMWYQSKICKNCYRKNKRRWGRVKRN